MFGTLTCHPQEPLTFVENVDLASALNRNRRDCPHISCESCRQKKIKCNGDPDGCDKCAGSSINCQYAVRDARRRKKRTATGDYNGTSPLDTNPTDANGNGCQSQQILEQMQQHFGNGGSGQARNSNNSRKTLHPTNDTTQQDMDCDMMQAILDNNSDYHTQWYPPRPAAPAKSISDSGIGIDDWASITALTDQAVPMNFETDWIDTGLRPGDADKGTTHSSDDWNHLHSRLMTLNNSHGPATTTSASTSKTHSLSSRASITDHGQREQNRRLRSRTELYDEDDLPFEDGSSWQPSPTSMSSTRKSVRSRDGSMLPSGSDVLQAVHRRGKPPTHGHGPGDCDCLATTAALLNELDGRSADYGTESVDVLLGYLRKALNHCRRVLDCGVCASRGEIVMILAIASQYMRVMAESVASHCIWLQESSSTASTASASASPLPPPSSTRNPKQNNNAQHDMSSRDDHFGAQKAAHDDDTPSSGDAIDNMWFSTYRIESHDERLYVLTTLVLVQITNLCQFLGMLKQRCDGRKGPLSLVQGAEKRCNEVSETLRERVFSRAK
ncbi:hypothetical protein MY4824_001493 [Beauveria thailandica]